MKHLKLIVIVVTALFSSLTLAQEPPRPGDPQFGAEGRLLILKVVPGDRTAKLFFVGKKAAELDFNKDHKLLSVTALKNGQTETLQFKNNGDSYEVFGLPGGKEPYSLGVKSEVKGKVEELKVKIQPAKP
ncbi:MAG: hypothetical protein OM95_09590 [Bdellovibrio sp. ArHS]|uniref:hypothetical protein n=1 Tax=Bdellovibrio sp. ArHS TaxID=1569284 RepID=UPI000583F829|nr:hypothetical protein [Bdellovibrio sp. ArHS]KHD88378.1 MAG: hypothetical protein OM95_09590 [Bdellovibrio sp. ArHS]